jgi:hypothetical protein
VNEFLWRRARNFNVTVALLQAQAQHQGMWQSIFFSHGAACINASLAAVFNRIWITLDDNAKFGLNLHEANELRALVAQLGLQNQVNIYPGADEVRAFGCLLVLEVVLT